MMMMMMIVNGEDNVFTSVCVCVCLSALSRSQFLTDFDEIWQRRLEPDMKDRFRWGEGWESNKSIPYFFTPFYPKLAPT